VLQHHLGHAVRGAFDGGAVRPVRHGSRSGSARFRQGADGQHLVGVEAFDLRFADHHDRDRFTQGVEDLKDAPGLSALGARDVIDQGGDVPLLEVLLGKLSLQSDTLIEG
jgi:hypothetical protein